MPQNGSHAPIVSEFASDPEMVELVEMFVDGLPAQLEMIRDAWMKNDLAAVATAAHQLKGAAGGYGYPTLTDAARSLELSARAASDLAGIRDRIDALAAMCDGIQAGLRRQG
jgi:HPt (histidine-containing phosphotransfer) domain-containing protein